MVTNFDYLQKEPKFKSFARVAVSAEKIILLDPEASILGSRRAMEFAVKWMYSVDKDLEMPYQDNLQSLMNGEDFRSIVGNDIWKRMDFIRKNGNAVAHGSKKLGREEATLCLENLFVFLDFLAYCYSEDYVQKTFQPSLITDRITRAKEAKQSKEDVERELAQERERAEKSKNDLEQKEVDLQKLIAENASLREELSSRRLEQQPTYVPQPLELTEYKTRKLYIDTLLRDAGWIEGKNWINEVELQGMPNKAEKGYADYVLYDDRHEPLAIIEAKRTCVDVAKGRQQAKLYADIIEKQYGRRPVIFLTNGFDIKIDDGQYPERRVAAIYSKRDLEKWFNLLRMRTSLRNIVVDKSIAGRYYQEGAIKAVCDSFDMKNRRKALLVMATGSGKTRTVIALCKVLMNAGWIKNILFLADRNSLVTQAKRNFVNLLPNLSCTNLVEDKDDYNAHCVFSTYQTMMNCIDSVKDEEGKLFSCGHFDLVICDEAHRSIYNKYHDIFDYFDAPLVGLTATPKDEIAKNTYEVFELENGVPTYGYELAQAVEDGYLIDYVSVETQLKIVQRGITYDDLSAEEKEEYEKTFVNEEGRVPEAISASSINSSVYNEDTIRKVLDILMTNGLKIEYGQKLGKTIIFAKNHRHAEMIKEVFEKAYPYLPGFAKVIDNQMTYAQSAIDEFSDPNKLPQIAISVDMLDTGIDVPEILNLVFFKTVMSKAKFWQMIGRGTRLCPGLIDGQDKSKFYIFDFCGNFEFFRASKGNATANTMSLAGAVYSLKFEISYKLQNMEYQAERLTKFRKALVDEMCEEVQKIPRNSFAVKQHLKYVDTYSTAANYDTLTYADTLQVREEVAPYVLSSGDEPSAVRFDALIYGIELAQLAGKNYTRSIKDLQSKMQGLSKVANIPAVHSEIELIDKILHTDFVECAGTTDWEEIRGKLRSLMKYLSHGHTTYKTNFTDEILSTEINESQLDDDSLKNYKAKAEFYIRQHQDNLVIAKLKTNKPLTHLDVTSLENILWKEIGTKQDYEKEYGSKPLGELVREIVGLDMNAAKEAFSQYLTDANLDSRQIYFVNQIVEYIVHNGMMKDLSVLQESPFTDQGSVVEIFTDLNVWAGIRHVIDTINANAVA